MNTPFRLFRIALGAVLVATLASCTNTRLESSWRAPQLNRLTFTTLMVVVPIADGATRRITEDALAKHLTSTQVLTSYSVLADDAALQDPAKIREIAKANGVQTVVVLRMVTNQTEVHYESGAYPPPYYRFHTYWAPRYGLAPMMYQPLVASTTQVIGTEITVYDLESDKLVWSGLMRTRDPSSIDAFVTEMVEVVRAQWQKEGLIP